MEEHRPSTGKQRLWVVTELYYPEETSTGYYLTKIAEGLADEFYVSVVCGQPNYSKRGIRAPYKERYHSVDIVRARGTTLDKNVILFRLANMFTLGLSVLFAAMRRFQKGDRVLVVTTPPLLPFVSAAAALIRGSGYSLLIHDNYPDILIAVGKTRPDSIFANIMERSNRWLFKHAERIVVVGRDMNELVTRKAIGLDIPVITIPNWAELETVNPRPRENNRLLSELGLSEKFVVLYAGNMGHPNDIESIVEAARLLKDRPDIHFIFLGSGVKRAWLEDEVRRNELSNVTILDPRPRADQEEFLNACDIGLISLVNKMKGVSMPSRTYNILAAGKPILAVTEDRSELAMVVNEERVGTVVPPGQPRQIVDAVLEMASDREKLVAMGKRARHAAETKYTLENAIGAYRAALLTRGDD